MKAKLQFNKEGYITAIPVNCIINKARPNCGATTCEINSPRNSIIIEPNLPVIEGKEISMQGKFFPVKNGVKVKEIKDYLKTTVGYKKFMTTGIISQVKRSLQCHWRRFTFLLHAV